MTSEQSDGGTYHSWVSEETREMFEKVRLLYILKLRYNLAKNMRNHMVSEGYENV